MRILSGIQPTGDKHLGNYFGAIPPVRRAAGAGRRYFCIVDLHAITVAVRARGPARVDAVARCAPHRLRARPRALDGLRPEPRARAPASGLGARVLSRATASCAGCPVQGEGRPGRSSASAGLFTYPVLEAADILLYQTDAVPVGDDQRQHLELSRDIAAAVQRPLRRDLHGPRGDLPEVGARIMDLQEPTSAMSTTGGTEQGTVSVLDPPDVDPPEVQHGGHRLGTRGAPRRRRSPASRT